VGSFTLSLLAADRVLRFVGTQYTQSAVDDHGRALSSSRNEKTTLFRPHLHITYRADSFGKEIFRVEYSTDRFGRRVTPLSSGERSKSLLIFGCSMAFGQTVNDAQTIAFYLGALLKDHEPYNYGVNGGGIQNLYAITTAVPLTREVPQSEGLAIYLYYPFHMNRLPTYFSNLRNYYNSYEVSEGHFKRLPLALFSRIFEGLGNSPLFERTATLLFPPPPLEEKDYQWGARLFKASMDLYKQAFPKGDFVVVMVGKDERMSRQLDALEVPHVSVEQIDPSLTYYPYDGHYKPQGNAKMALQIVDALRRRSPHLARAGHFK